MKIQSLKIQNFLGIRHLDMPLTELNLFSGLNASGKSSLENAIRLAYTGELSRIGLKKELGQLVHEGQKQATIEIEGDPGTEGGPIRISEGGKSVGIPNPEDAPWWAHALTDMTYLRTLDPTALRRCLFQMAGAANAAEVEKRLLAGGVMQSAIDVLRPLLTRFDAAAADAKSRESEAKGEWKGLTGETYGEVKAETWAAPVPALPPEPEDRTEALEQAADALRTEIAAIKAAETGRQQVENDLRQARTAAETLPVIRGQLDAAKADVEATERAVKVWEAKAAGQALPEPVGKPVCPECGAVVCLMPDSTLMTEADHAEQSKAAPDPKAKTALAAAQKELKEYTAKHARLAEEVKRIERLTEGIAGLVDKLKDLKAADLLAVQAKLAVNVAEQMTNADLLAAYSSAARAARDADGKTAKAKAAHEQAKQWALVKTLMSPDGIPADFLGDVLTKLNDRLRTSADRTKWGQVQVHADMRLTYGGRALGLCSESERWRAEAMLTEAIGYLTAEGFLMLDRLDVLHQDQRTVLVEWCESLAKEGTQCLLFGTLKAPVAIPGWTSIWLEKGERK